MEAVEGDLRQREGARPPQVERTRHLHAQVPDLLRLTPVLRQIQPEASEHPGVLAFRAEQRTRSVEIHEQAHVLLASPARRLVHADGPQLREVRPVRAWLTYSRCTAASNAFRRTRQGSTRPGAC